MSPNVVGNKDVRSLENVSCNGTNKAQKDTVEDNTQEPIVLEKVSFCSRG